MNSLDIAVCVVVVGLIVLGYIRGFVRQLLSIAGLVAALAAAYFFYEAGAEWIKAYVPLETIQSYDKYRVWVEGLRLDVYFYNAVAFLLIFWLVRLGLAVAGGLLHLITLVPGLHAMNKWSGALLGLAEGLVLTIITLHVLTIVPSDGVQGTLDQSRIAPALLKYAPVITELLDDLWNQVK